MGLRISTNVQSLTARRNLNQTKQRQDKALAKLSSGQRINRAGDDAAGLAISEKLNAEIRGSRQAERNAGDGISLIQTAEGGLNEIANIVVRLRELSVQAASDTVGEQERKFADVEFQNLNQEIQRIATSTQYNGLNLLDGSGGELDIQVGIKNSPEKDRIVFDAGSTDVQSGSLEIESLGIAEKVGAQESLAVLDQAINKISESRSNLGALQNRLSSTISGLQIQTENLSAANSRIRDTDVAEQSAELVKQNILAEAGQTVLVQANTGPNSALRLLG